jgi:hypothetical protein
MMADAATELGSIAETIVFLDYFKELPDYRQPGKVIYPLNEVLLLLLPAVLAGAETFCDIARFTGALLDRLAHHLHILEMNGDSYRLNQSKRRSRPARSDAPANNPTQA